MLCGHRRSELGILAISGAPSLTPRQWLVQLPLMAAVSAGAGLLGASFNLMRRRLRRLSPPSRTAARSLGEAMAVAALTVAVIAALSAAVGSCRPLPEHWEAGDVVQHLCPDGQYNDLASMFLGSSGEGWSGLGPRWPPRGAGRVVHAVDEAPCRAPAVAPCPAASSSRATSPQAQRPPRCPLACSVRHQELHRPGLGCRAPAHKLRPAGSLLLQPALAGGAVRLLPAAHCAVVQPGGAGRCALRAACPAMPLAELPWHARLCQLLPAVALWHNVRTSGPPSTVACWAATSRSITSPHFTTNTHTSAPTLQACSCHRS